MPSASPAPNPSPSPSQALRISIVALAWRQGWRDFRAGELRLLMVAVVLAVAALSAVGFFATRLEAALARDAAALMGGDAVVASDQPAPPAFAERARSLGLQQALSASFPSMARAPDNRGGEARLVSVKAVSTGYPLRGALRLQAQADGPVQNVTAAPARGTAWVEAGVLDALQLKLGNQILAEDTHLPLYKVRPHCVGRQGQCAVPAARRRCRRCKGAAATAIPACLDTIVDVQPHAVCWRQPYFSSAACIAMCVLCSVLPQQAP